MKHHQDGIGGVDHGDQYCKMGAGFASKSYYKKWYKQLFFDICDFMILHSFFAWNNSTSNAPEWRKVKKDKSYVTVAHELINYQVTQSDLGEL